MVSLSASVAVRSGDVIHFRVTFYSSFWLNYKYVYSWFHKVSVTQTQLGGNSSKSTVSWPTSCQIFIHVFVFVFRLVTFLSRRKRTHLLCVIRWNLMQTIKLCSNYFSNSQTSSSSWASLQQPGFILNHFRSELKCQVMYSFEWWRCKTMLEDSILTALEKKHKRHGVIVCNPASQSRTYRCNHPDVIDVWKLLGVQWSYTVSVFVNWCNMSSCSGFA